MLYIGIFILLPLTSCRVLVIKPLNTDINKNETFLHLQNSKIKDVCNNRTAICKNNDTICTMRDNNGLKEWKEFNNSCFLFISNMCDYPGEEFHIASRGSCVDYLKLNHRRHSIVTTNRNIARNSTKKLTTKGILRGDSFVTLYEVETSFDEHICPLSCPDTYSPVCVNLNRNVGEHFKFLTFVNHCEADRYYCMNWEDFSPPDDVSREKVQSAQLGWSFCGASRYLQFARFAEVASSLGHYGWLEGEKGYSHIMEPYERKPGYG
ncbi:uncharacterized protein [Epargyreus clarus]|uniref:uncharacterized protein n=1 Tax=Epargyreus clarus TaxID=520877 RepID=UPI003C2C5D59